MFNIHLHGSQDFCAIRCIIVGTFSLGNWRDKGKIGIVQSGLMSLSCCQSVDKDKDKLKGTAPFSSKKGWSEVKVFNSS